MADRPRILSVLGAAFVAFQPGLTAIEVSGVIDADTAWNNTAEPYVIDNFFGPLTVAAGTTLDIAAGVTVRAKYSNKSILQIEGTLSATQVTFDIKTSNSTAGGKRAVSVTGSGRLFLESCTVEGEHVSAFAADSVFVEANGSAVVDVQGTRFLTGLSGIAVARAVVCRDGAQLSLAAAGSGVRNQFSGFSTPIYLPGSAAANIGGADFSGFTSAIQFKGGAGSVTDCHFEGSGDSRAVIFHSNGRDLTLQNASFSGGSRGVVFDAQGGNLLVDGSDFIDCGMAIEVLTLESLTFNDSSIGGSGMPKGITGIYTDVLTAFSASNSSISQQEKGIRVAHAHRDMDVSGIVFSNNDIDVFAGGAFTLPRTLTEDVTLLPGRYLIDNNSGPIVVEAGVILELLPGTVIENQRDRADLFLVRGRVKAEGVRFELTTHSNAGGLSFVEGGIGEFTECDFYASATAASSTTQAILKASGSAQLAIAGCSFATDAPARQPMRGAIRLVDQAGGTIDGTSGGPTRIEGFPMGVWMASGGDLAVRSTELTDNVSALWFESDANLLLEQVTFSSNEVGLSVPNIGFWAVAITHFEGNERAVDFQSNWLSTALNRDGFDFANNTHDLFVQTGGFVLDTNLTMEPGSYTVDCDGVDHVGAPLVIAQGASLRIPAGTHVRTIDSAETANWGIYGRNTYQLFQVLGSLEADQATFDWRTFSHGPVATGNHTHVIELVGQARAQFFSCHFEAGDRTRHFGGNSQAQARVFHLSDNASLTLNGCGIVARETSIEGDETWRTGIAIAAEGNSRLTLRGNSGLTRIRGFESGLRYTSSGVFTAAQTAIEACARAIDFDRSWRSAAIDTTGITLADNGDELFLKTGGVILDRDLEMAPGRYTIDCDGEINTGSPLTIAAGATLRLPAGTVIRTVDSAETVNNRNFYRNTYQLFKVLGGLEAVDVTFVLRTFSYTQTGWSIDNHTRVFDLADQGVGSFTGCRFAAGDRTRQFGAGSFDQARVFHLDDAAALTLEGCELATAESEAEGDQIWRTGFAIAAEGNSRLTLSGPAEPTLIRGFAGGLRYRASGDFVAENTILRECDRAIDFDDAWASSVIDSGAIQFVDNQHERYLRTAGVTLNDDVRMGAGNYTVDCDGEINVGSPVTIAMGATLTIPAGTVIRSVDSVESANNRTYYTNTYQLWKILGAVEAVDVRFVLRTFSYANAAWSIDNHTRVFEFRDQGAGTFTRCQFESGDRTRGLGSGSHLKSSLFHLSGSASLALNGCDLSTAESEAQGDQTWRVGFGIVSEATSRLRLAGDGDPLVIRGFVGGIRYRAAGDFAANDTTITDCDKAIDFDQSWASAVIDSGAIQFVGNVHERFLRTAGTTIERDLTMAPGEYTVDCDGESNVGDPLTIAAGARLTLQPGTTLRTVDSVEVAGGSSFSLNTYQLFKVRGALSATDVTLVARTFSHSNLSRGIENHTHVIELLDQGTADLAGCRILAGDRTRQLGAYFSGRSQVIHLASGSSLRLSGCELLAEESEAAGDLTWRTAYGIAAEGDSVVLLEDRLVDGLSVPTRIGGFSVAGLAFSGNASLSMDGVSIADCATGLEHNSSGAIELGEVTVSGCEFGFRQPGVNRYFSTSTVTFLENDAGHLLRGGFTVSGELTLQPGRYDFDCNDGPIVIGARGRMVLAPGCTVAAYDSGGGDAFDLFVVEGTLDARGSTFQLTTRSQNGNAWTTGILVRSGGVATFDECLLRSSDLLASRDSRVIEVRDQGGLRLQGCRLETTRERSDTTYFGVWFNASGPLALQDCFVAGFPVALRLLKLPASYAIAGNDFVGNTTYAVWNSAASVVDATDNGWGHPSGPRHRTNPLGSGDPVSDKVEFLPYRTELNLPTALLRNHDAGQVGNQFVATGDASDALVFRFGLDGDDDVSIGSLALAMADREALSAANLSDVRLVWDEDEDGAYDPGTDSVIGGGTVDWENAVWLFEGAIQVNRDYLVLADFANLASGVRLQLSLSAYRVGVDVGHLVLGGAVDAIHFLDQVILSDHRTVRLGDALLAHETQNEVVLLGFHMSPGARIAGLSFDLEAVTGIASDDIGGVELVEDTNGSGRVEPGEPVLGRGAVELMGGTGRLRFEWSDAPPDAGSNWLVRADFVRLAKGDALTVSLDAAGVTAADGESVVRGSVKPVRHVVDGPLFVLDAAFQVDNRFAEASPLGRTELLAFTFIPSGRVVGGLTFDLPDVCGIRDWEISNVRVHPDRNMNGRIDPDETDTVSGPGVVTIDPRTGKGTIRFDGSFVAQGTYLLVADFGDVELDDCLSVVLTHDGVAVSGNDVVDGAVSTVRHVVQRPDVPPTNLQQNWTLTWRSPGGLSACGGFSRDGKRAVIGYDSGAAYVYDLASGAPKLMLMRHYDKVEHAGFSADDSQIITVTRDGAVYLWEAGTGILTRSLFADVLVKYAVPSPDFGRLLVVTEGRALLLNLLDGIHLWEFDVGAELTTADFSPDGSRVIIGSKDKRAYVLDADTGGIPRNEAGFELIFQGHHDEVHGVAFAANGSRILTASTDATATLWYADDPVNPITTVDLNEQRADFAWVNREGTRIAMITQTGRLPVLRLFDDQARELYAYDLPVAQFTGSFGFAAFSDDGVEMMIGSDHVANLASGSLVVRFRTGDHRFLGALGPRGLVSDQRASPATLSGDGHRVFFQKRDGMEILQRTTGAPIRRYDDLNQSMPYSVTPDGAKIAWLAPNPQQGHSTLNLAVVDDDRLTRVAANPIPQGQAPITLSRSGGLAIVGDKLFRSASGALFADSPNIDGYHWNAFTPDERYWGIAIGQSIKTMETSDATGGLEFAVTLTGDYTPKKVLYHPDGIRVGCVFDGGVQFYRLDNNEPVGFYDNRGPGLLDAALSHDGTMLLVSRGNSVRLYDMRTARVLRYFYPLHSGQAASQVRAIAFGSHDDIIMIAWSDNYIETYERSRLIRLELSPAVRSLPVGNTQAFVVEAVYDDGGRQDVSPRRSRTREALLPGARLYASPGGMVDIVENRVTVLPDARGAIELKAVYTEGGILRTAIATIHVGEGPLVELIPELEEVTLTHGVVLPLEYTAVYADGYREIVDVTLTADPPEFVRIVGKNVTILRGAGARDITITGSYEYQGTVRTAVTRIFAHGPQSNWVREQVTSGGDVYAMDYRPDGQQLATGGSSGAVSLYEVGASPTTYRLQKVLPAHERLIRHLFYRDQDHLVTVGEDGWIRTWDLNAVDQPVREYSHDAAITCAAYRDGSLVFGDNLGRVQVLALDTNVIRWSAVLHENAVRAVALDEDSVFSGGNDRRAVLSRRDDGGRIMAYPGYSEPVIAVGYRQGLIFTISDDKRLVEWVKGTVDEALWEYFLPNEPTAVRQTADRLYIATGSSKAQGEGAERRLVGFRSVTWVYDENGLLLNQLEHPPELGKITALAVSPDGTYLLTGRSTVVEQLVVEGVRKVFVFDFHSAQFWHAARSSYRGSLDHNRSIESARISQGGEWLLTQSSQRVFRWNLAGELVADKFLETGYNIPYRFDELRSTGDEAGITATRIGGTIYLLDVADRLLSKSVHTVASTFDISPDGARLVTNRDPLRLWDVGVDFPTVIHERPKPAENLAFLPTGTSGRQGDILAGINDTDFCDDEKIPWEPFLGILNDEGLQFSGVTVPVEMEEIESGGLGFLPGGEVIGATLKRTVAVSRNQDRCAVVLWPRVRGLSACGDPIHRADIYVYDLGSNRLEPQLVRKVSVSARNGNAAVALSDDGSLLFYGGEELEDQGVATGVLIDLNTGRELYRFAPPSIGTVSNRGPAAAQFTRNDGALMIAWREGYATVYRRQGLDRLEITPVAKTVRPGESVRLQANAVYVGGSRWDATDDAEWTLRDGTDASLSGSNVTVSSSAPPGTEIVVDGLYRGLGTTRSATATLSVEEPVFVELVPDPVRLSTTPGAMIQFQYFARMADGSAVDVTPQTTLTASPEDRVVIENNTIRIPPFAQLGYVEVTGRATRDGDEREAVSVLNIRNPLTLVDPGDFNGDNRVDFPDLLYLVAHYKETTASPKWDARCDFDSNGRIDFDDVMHFIGLYGSNYGPAMSFHPGAALASVGPTAEFRLEGPDHALAVGEAFEVRIFAREHSSEAIGVTGMLLDLLYGTGVVAPIVPFDPDESIHPPYNGILTHGEIRPGRIAGLGGVTIRTGHGDQDEVLFARLRFVAVAPGQARISLDPGRSKMTLTQPIGSLSADRIQFGTPLMVQVVGDAFLSGFELWKGDASEASATYGFKDGASDVFNAWDGDVEGIALGKSGGEIGWELAGDDLSTDIRGTLGRQIWRLRLVLPPNAPEGRPWRLTWPAAAMPEGMLGILIPADGDSELIDGVRRCLNEAGTWELAHHGATPAEVRYWVVWDRPMQQTLNLRVGWTAVGFGLEPDPRWTDAIMSSPAIRAVVKWVPGSGYTAPEQLNSRTGYLFHAAEDQEVGVTGIPPLKGNVGLREGWNLVSPQVPALLPLDAGEIVTGTGAPGDYDTARLHPGQLGAPNAAYWIRIPPGEPSTWSNAEVE